MPNADNNALADGPPLCAREALERLRAGNDRYAANLRSIEAMVSHTRRAQTVELQRPIAIILGCSDARAPAEVVFDQGLGDLFVIRVAGNIVAPSQVGSVEFAAERFGTRLVMVMGHSRCGAVAATVEDLLMEPARRSPNIRSIVERVQPAVEPLVRQGLRGDELMRASVRANVRASAQHLRHGSPILECLIEREGLVVVGAEYELETGIVHLFDGVPI